MESDVIIKIRNLRVVGIVKVERFSLGCCWWSFVYSLGICRIEKVRLEMEIWELCLFYIWIDKFLTIVYFLRVGIVLSILYNLCIY